MLNNLMKQSLYIFLWSFYNVAYWLMYLHNPAVSYPQLSLVYFQSIPTTIFVGPRPSTFSRSERQGLNSETELIINLFFGYKKVWAVISTIDHVDQ